LEKKNSEEQRLRKNGKEGKNAQRNKKVKKRIEEMGNENNDNFW